MPASSPRMQPLTEAKYLKLSRNQIASIETGDFETLNDLKELNLVRNRITRLEKGGFGWANRAQPPEPRKKLNRQLESGVFDGLPSLVVLDLFGIESSGWRADYSTACRV